MSARKIPEPKQTIIVVTDCTEHPFKSNTEVEVQEVRGHGVVYAKSKDGLKGFLVPDDYMLPDLSE